MKRILAVDSEALVRKLEQKVTELESKCAALEEDSRQRHEVEEALRRSEERWWLIYEHEPECVKIVSPQGLLVTMNPAGLKMIDADSLDEVRGKPLLELVMPEHREAFRALHQKVIAGQSGELEFEIIGLRGTRRWLETHAAPLPNSDGTVSLLGITRDITERKRTEEALRESEARYRLLADYTDDFICLLDTQGNRLYVSPSYFRVTGWTYEEIQRIDWRTRVHPDELPMIERTRAANLAGESTLIEHRIRCKDGSWLWVELRCKPIRGPDGCVSQMLLWSRDITARKRMEQTLLENQTRLQLLVKSSNIGLWDWDLLTNEVFFSPEWKRQVGCSDAEIPGRYEEWESRLHPDDRDRALAVVNDFRTGRRSDYDVEFRLRHTDGSWRWILSRADMLYDAEGQPSRMMGCHVDITERMRSEELLKEREQQLRLFVEHSPAAIAMFDADMRYLLASRRWLSDYNLGQRTLTGLSHYEVFPEIPERWKEIHRRCLAGAIEKCDEDPFLRADGTLEWIRWEIRPWHKAQGEVGGLIMLTEVITERKRAETALRASQDMLEMILDSIPQGVFWKDRNSVYLGANRVSRQALGFDSAESIIGKTDFDGSSLRRDQVEFYVRTDREVMESNQPRFGIKETMTHASGSTIWLETNKMPMHDTAGNVTGILGTWQDITERRLADEELRASRERLATLSRQLLATQENERRHLARELHDEIGQALTGIKLNLKSLQQAQAPNLQKLAQDTIDVVDQTLQQVRNLALDLRPSMLDDLGLVAALRWCLDRQSQRAGFTAQFIVASPICAASQDIETACFRVVQECLTNIARHAQARQVLVKLRQQDRVMKLLVQDDGIGFDVTAARDRAARGESLGLLGVQERVQLVGGQMDIESAPNRGTTIRAQFPWDEATVTEGDTASHAREHSP